MVSADIVIMRPAPWRERIAVVEVKNRLGLLPEDGTDPTAYMRLTGGQARYFMLVSQEVGYVWTQPQAAPYRFDMTAVIRRFIPDLAPGRRLFGMSVESLVAHWLGILAAGLRSDEEEPERTLASIGFLDAIRGAEVLSKAIA